MLHKTKVYAIIICLANRANQSTNSAKKTGFSEGSGRLQERIVHDTSWTISTSRGKTLREVSRQFFVRGHSNDSFT